MAVDPKTVVDQVTLIPSLHIPPLLFVLNGPAHRLDVESDLVALLLTTRPVSQPDPGYALFQQKRQAEPGDTGREDRRDAYLYGSTRVHRFRSPEEFQPHADWLLDGMRNVCRCKYCSPVGTA